MHGIYNTKFVFVSVMTAVVRTSHVPSDRQPRHVCTYSAINRSSYLQSCLIASQSRLRLEAPVCAQLLHSKTEATVESA